MKQDVFPMQVAEALRLHGWIADWHVVTPEYAGVAYVMFAIKGSNGGLSFAHRFPPAGQLDTVSGVTWCVELIEKQLKQRKIYPYAVKETKLPTATHAAPVRSLERLFDMTQQVEVGCGCLSIPRIGIKSAVMHLNDIHRWTREAIADWLEAQDVDLTVRG